MKTGVRSKLGAVVIHVLLPLALGVGAYVALRSEDVRIVAWLARAAPDSVQSARTGGAAMNVPRVIAGSFPDLAWAWAFGAMLAIVWSGRAFRDKAPWLAAGAGVALFCELGQAWGLVPGTFDLLDLLAIAIGYVAGAAVSGAGRSRRPTRAPAPPPCSSRGREAPPCARR